MLILYWVLLKPPTTDPRTTNPLTTYHLPTDPPTSYPPIYVKIEDQILNVLHSIILIIVDFIKNVGTYLFPIYW